MSYKGKTLTALFLTFTIFLTSVLGCLSCASLKNFDQTNTKETKAKRIAAITQQYNSTVTIVGLCSNGTLHRGSGVIISSNYLLTAFHVVNCEGLFSATTVEGQIIAITKDIIKVNSDIARMKTISLTFDTKFINTNLSIAQPLPGDNVCISAAIPRQGRHCGEIQYTPNSAAEEVIFDAVTEPGNSGSGVYDDTTGDLVGILIQLRMCVNYQYCDGAIVVLHNKQWLLEK